MEARPKIGRHLRIHAAALNYFDAVRRAGSIRAAARRLNVASSAVNRQILSLEAEVGTQLFHRLPGGLKLTAAGEILAHHVITVLRDAERAESELDALHGLRAGVVELVTLEGSATVSFRLRSPPWLSGAAGQRRCRYPGHGGNTRRRGQR